ncbi:probable inactive poly [ADP-ribose] polymerase SRO2 [Nymphaea colorata]|nr:probable inactive poly [ADP-ribose] polymerase SRO2 [Nymphaea colorata]
MRNRATRIAKRIRALVSGESLNSANSHRGIGRCGGDVGEPSCCCRRALARNAKNFRKSKAPSRVMFYRESMWDDYPDDVFQVLRDGFVNGKAAVHLETAHSSLVVDFLRMLEVNLQHGSQRRIAWIDIEGHCFFPEIFAGENCRDCGASPRVKMEAELKVRGEDGAADMAESSVVVPDARAELQPAVCAELPGCARPAAALIPSSVPSTKALLLKLKEDDGAFNIIKTVFLRGMRKQSPETTVTAVYRCPYGTTRFQEFKRAAERTKAARGHTNMRYAWHGTSPKDVGAIVFRGFGETNICSGPGAFGVGISLSPASHSYLSASMAEPADNGERHVILCRVVMGNIEELELGSQQAKPSCEEFDNGVDDVMNSRRYIVWSTNMNSHILPEYVVTFTNSVQTQGLRDDAKSMQRISRGCEAPPSSFPGVKAAYKPVDHGADARTAPHSRMSFPHLFAALGKSLPTFKTRALDLLYNGYKAGNINKDVLIRKVRSIVGDPLLVSAIRSIGRQI